MNAAPNANTQIEPPRQGVGGLNARTAPVFTGGPIKNFPQNHPPVAESNTSSAPYIVPAGEYHPGYIDQMLAYFDRPKNREIIDTYTWKSGAVSEKVRYVPNTPPHFSEFARKIGVTTRTLKRWCRDHPEFKDAYDQCQEILEEFLIDNGLTGGYGAIAMKFVAVNRSKMKDKSVQENQVVDVNKILDLVAQGKVKPGGAMELEQGDE